VRVYHLLSEEIFTEDRQLFGEDEDATGELDEAEKQGENGVLACSYLAIIDCIMTSSGDCHLAERSSGL